MDLAPLVYQRTAFLDGQWWLPLTSQFVHLSSVHALMNVASACLLAGLFRSWIPWRQQCAVLAGGGVAVAITLVADARCDYYAGASGALHGWAAGGALLLLEPLFRPRRARLIPRAAALAPMSVAACLWVGLVIKLAWQCVQTTPVVAWGLQVYVPSHVAGVVGGGLVGAWLVGGRWWALKRPGDKPHQPQHNQL